MKTFFTIILIAFSVSFSACKSGTSKTETEEIAEVYTCPMHPEVESKEPGDCPKCGMSLVKENENEDPDSSSNADDEIE